MSGIPMTLMLVILAPFTGSMMRRFPPVQLMTAGLLAATVGLAGMTQLTTTTPYLAILPLYVLQGLGMAVSLPAASAVAMASVDRMRSGVASGVLNTTRQVGAALGLAVLGAVGAVAAGHEWAERAPQAPNLREAVIGGQTAMVERALGPGAREVAAHAFVSGTRAAMWVGCAITLAAALLVWFGLRRSTPAPQAAPTGDAA